MANIRIFFLSFIMTSLSPSVLFSSVHNNNQLEAWRATYVNNMSPAELQLLGNFFYLSCAIIIIESKLRQFNTPISRLNQSIRTSIVAYKNPNDDLTTLKTLLDRLSYVNGARTVYMETLTTFTNYYNANNTPLINAALESIQLDAQRQLREWANTKTLATQQQLKKCADNIINKLGHVQTALGFYKGMSENEFPVDFPEEIAQDKALYVIDIITKNNPELLTITEEIINLFNETNDYAAQIIPIGAEIYKQYYAVVYDTLMAPDYNKEYATTMFSMYDMLAEEYKTLLPDAQHIFEHALQTTKLYTQTEVLQHS